MPDQNVAVFRTLVDRVGGFRPGRKTMLIPEMNRIGCSLLAATFRAFGIRALVMETGRGLALGKAYTSGKECYPCQITTGDILYHMQTERERLKERFNPEDYIYIMPEAAGPCRFGMYNKYQRIVLDSVPGLEKLKIGSLTAEDAYDLGGILDRHMVADFRKLAYLAVVVGDILDRLLLRLRPYERREGSTDAFIETARCEMADTFEASGAERRAGADRILGHLYDLVRQGCALIDPAVAPKPLIGVVGEIYLRNHTGSNQDLFRGLEAHGAEVVNASVAEWIHFTDYQRVRKARKALRVGVQQRRLNSLRGDVKDLLKFGGELLYQQHKQKKAFRRVAPLIGLAHDHSLGQLEKILQEKDLFHFDIGTEACLSIAGILAYARDGYNGVVNVFPFTCMPSTMTSAIVKPLMTRERVPYLDAPYDESYQPGRETALRTFLYQARQHCQRHGRPHF